MLHAAIMLHAADSHQSERVVIKDKGFHLIECAIGVITHHHHRARPGVTLTFAIKV